jgi:hypothetical protein
MAGQGRSVVTLHILQFVAVCVVIVAYAVGREWLHQHFKRKRKAR